MVSSNHSNSQWFLLRMELSCGYNFHSESWLCSFVVILNIHCLNLLLFLLLYASFLYCTLFSSCIINLNRNLNKAQCKVKAVCTFIGIHREINIERHFSVVYCKCKVSTDMGPTDVDLHTLLWIPGLSRFVGVMVHRTYC